MGAPSFLLLLAAAGAAGLAAAGGGAPPSSSHPAPHLLASAECGRCHDLTALPELPRPPRERSCAGCHAWIRSSAGDPAALAAGRAEFPQWDRYVHNVRSFLEVPDLGLAAARLDPAWIARYLRAPYDVRPGLPEEMIRTAWTEAQARAAATWLASTARARVVTLSREARDAASLPLSPDRQDIATGAALYRRLGCGQCHALGEARPATTPQPGAPDLIHVAYRMGPADVAALIADPASYGLEARMPRYPINAVEAARLRDFLFDASRGADRRTMVAPMPEPELPLLERRISYAEVRTRVLAAVCVHCHMDPARNPEGGPGNTGGLTYRGSGLDLESWRGVARGVRREDGRRVSVLAPPPEGGEPLLVARLRARYGEHAREQTGPHAVQPGGPPGMPLGLPPLSAADFQLVRSWVAQGAPGPERRR